MNTQLHSALDPGDDVKQIEPDKAMPSKLVLDIEEPLMRFKDVLGKFVETALEVEVVIGDVLSCLTHREEAEFEIAHSSYEMLPANVNIVEPGDQISGVVLIPSEQNALTEYRPGEITNSTSKEIEIPHTGLIEIPDGDITDAQALQLIDARERLAKDLLKLFDDYKLYRNGRLFYQIEKLLGTALVLGKIGIPFLAEDQRQLRYVDNSARQADCTARRRRDANASLHARQQQPFISLWEQYGSSPAPNPMVLPGRTTRRDRWW